MSATEVSSRESWDELKGSEKLGRMQRIVYTLLDFYGPMTAREIEQIMKEEHPEFAADTAHKRLSELRKVGAIVEDGRKDCPVTGKKTTVWRIVKKESKS